MTLRKSAFQLVRDALERARSEDREHSYAFQAKGHVLKWIDVQMADESIVVGCPNDWGAPHDCNLLIRTEE